MKQKIIIYGFLILLILCNSCKKHSTIDSHQNNIVNATIAFSSGNKVIINATGLNAAIGYSLYFDVTNVKGTNDVNEAVFLSFDNVSATGTYPFLCQYYVKISLGTSSEIYDNTGAVNPGSITITASTEHHIEANFNATCKSSLTTDSVLVTGFFKGDY